MRIKCAIALSNVNLYAKKCVTTVYLKLFIGNHSSLRPRLLHHELLSKYHGSHKRYWNISIYKYKYAAAFAWLPNGSISAQDYKYIK